jgi:hypothetical protein
MVTAMQISSRLKKKLSILQTIYSNLTAALKNPVLECCNPELLGTALNVAD